MKPLTHLLFSSILAAVFYPIFGWKALLVLAGGVLIDIDHYLWYIYKHKSLNLISAYKFYINNVKTNNYSNVYGILLIFHSIEFFIVMTFLSFYIYFTFIFMIGLLFHYLLDLIFLYRGPKHFIVNHSIIYWIYKKTR